MELSFGCELFYKHQVRTKFVAHFEPDWYAISPSINGNDTVYFSDATIVGHPIRLEHVLRAIGADKSHKAFLQFSQVLICSPSVGWTLLVGWEGQSEETKRFVGGLLGSTE